MIANGRGLVAAIRGACSSAVIHKCEDEKCCLRTDGLCHIVMLKGEALTRKRKICDCLLFIEVSPVLVVLAELKSKTVDASDVAEKLETALEYSRAILDRLGSPDHQVICLVLAKRWAPSSYRVLSKKRVICGGRRFAIVPKRCGDQLLTILKQLRCDLPGTGLARNIHDVEERKIGETRKCLDA